MTRLLDEVRESTRKAVVESELDLKLKHCKCCMHVNNRALTAVEGATANDRGRGLSLANACILHFGHTLPRYSDDMARAPCHPPPGHVYEVLSKSPSLTPTTPQLP